MQVLQRFSQVCLFVFATQFAVNSSAGAVIPELENMPQLGKQAQQEQLPIMLLFSAEWCEYCELLQDQVLNPMERSGMYRDYMILRHVGIDIDGEISDWQGKRYKNKAEWAYRINADLTPTVLFVDGAGREIAERIIGVSEVSMFSILVHSRLNDAYQRMGIAKRIPATPEKLEALLKKQ